MSITPIGTDQTSTVSQVQALMQHHGHGGMHKAGMEAAAKDLGMSTSDLRTALQNGQSMADLAKSKGVSLDTLTSDISAAVSKANPSVSSERAQQIALRMIAGPDASSTSTTSTTGTTGTTGTLNLTV